MQRKPRCDEPSKLRSPTRPSNTKKDPSDLVEPAGCNERDTMSIAHIGTVAATRFQLGLFGARPYFPFYPGDWQRNAKLRICSLAARALWLEMICIMHQAEPYGHLKIGPQKVTNDLLARALGESIKDILPLLRELENAGVFSRESDETIVCRRMIRDEKLRAARASGGIKSLENPKVPRPKGILDGIHQGPRQGPVSVLSLSTSTSESESNNVRTSASNELRERMYLAGLRRSQASKALKRGVEFVHACVAYLDAPTDDADNPIAIIGACIRDGTNPPPPKAAPMSATEAAEFEHWRRDHRPEICANMDRLGLNSSNPKYEQTVLAMFRKNSQEGAA